MVYGSEAILPTDIAFRAPRVEHYDEEQAIAIQTEDVDRVEEERLITCIHIAKYLEGLRRYYNRNIKGRSFAIGDLVLHRDAQALLPLGRALRSQRGYPTRVVPAM